MGLRGRYGFKERIEAPRERDTRRVRRKRVAGVWVKPEAVTMSGVCFCTRMCCALSRGFFFRYGSISRDKGCAYVLKSLRCASGSQRQSALRESCVRGTNQVQPSRQANA